MNSLAVYNESSLLFHESFYPSDLEYYILKAYSDAVHGAYEVPDFFAINEFFDYHLNFANRDVFNVGSFGLDVNKYEMTFELIEETLDLMRASFVNMLGEELNNCQNELFEEE